jgi:phospholipid transport system substrate-binding protein
MPMKEILRRSFLALALLAFAPLAVMPAAAAGNPAQAQQFVADNIHKGLDLLNNKSLSVDQRRTQFEQFLLGLTDMNRIAVFTLGNYRRQMSDADQKAFEAAFQNYAVTLYQSYFQKYAGQALKVTGVQQRAPDDFVVSTVMIDPNDHSGQAPAEVDFRVRTDEAKPVVIDVAYAGIFVAITERDSFTAFLGQNNGNAQMLIGHLNELAKQFR